MRTLTVILQRITLLLTLLLTALPAQAVKGTLIGHEIKGTRKICFYRVLASTEAITIKSYQLCPLSHDF
ncbi:hypothetical protein [Marinobacterium weihaiense]|uniref:Uncharacterized protein n=1 Tax=Marinobacterium weihaiense TaxID=2851016 RepID=A0ABS6MF36_9GAMM|nr:hypothetical protein [Marinobacterium weihaiense]MBV0934908.1 hypothetical protein [Marinobacterium weihaiense]